ncbi:MAG: radical SAM protein [Promethearchaeota archaeon]
MRCGNIEYKYLKELRQDEFFGIRLPVDFNPPKTCSFNCVYCPLGNTTRQIMDREEFFPPEDIFREIYDYIEKNGEPDYVWLKGNGEPTLYSGFKRLTQLIIQNYPGLKIGSWLNGSLLYREDVRSDFSICDLIVLHLDSSTPKEFLKISRHHKDVKFYNVIEGIKLFKNNFKGRLGISTVFLRNINANEKNLKGLKELVLEISPDFYLIQESNDEKFKPLTEEFKAKIKEIFSDLPFQVRILL